MNRLARIAAAIDHIAAALAAIARLALLLLMVAVGALVLMRAVFSLGPVWLTDALIYLAVLAILLAVAETLRRDGHVRVDVFYAQASARIKAWIDLAGTLLLLLPFMAAVAWFALPYVMRAVEIREGSREIAGLPFLYLLKVMIPLFAVHVGMQGLAQALRAVIVLRTPPAARS